MSDHSPTASAVDSAFLRFRDHGDPGALDLVFQATATELLGLARHLVHDLHAAEDLVQATFMTAIDAAARFEDGSRVTPWLVGILTNQVRNHRRARKRLPVDADGAIDDAPGFVAEPSAEANARELRKTLERAMAGLAEPYREVVDLTVRGGLLAREIAAKLSRPAGTVRSQITRGIEMLRRGLPAGMAPGLATVSAGHRLEAIRSAVVSRAREAAECSAQTGAGVTTAKLGPIAAVAGLAIVAAVAIAIGFGGWSTDAARAVASQPEHVASEIAIKAPATDPNPLDDAGTRTPIGSSTPQQTPRGPASSAAILTGRCVDAAGLPIAGVGLVGLRRGATQGPPLRHAIGPTDDSGRFRIDLASLPERPAEITFESREFVVACLDATTLPATGADLGDIVLRRGVLVHGRVVGLEADGDAAQGITLIREQPTTASRNPRVEPRPIAETDIAASTGTFVFDARVAPGRHRVLIQGVLRVSPEFVMISEEDASQQVELQVELFGAVPPIRGFVVDEAGRPVPGAIVIGDAVGERQPRLFPECRTDAFGRFEITRGDPAVAELWLVPLAERLEGAAVSARWGDSTVELRMRTRRFIELRVADRETGEPCERFDFEVVRPGEIPTITIGPDPARTETRRPDGRVELEANQLPCRVAIDLGERGMPTFADVAANTPSPVIVNIDRPRACRVRAVDEADRPVAGVEVSLLRSIGGADPEQDPIMSWSGALWETRAVGVVATASTDAAGCATIMASTATTYVLAIQADGASRFFVRGVRLSPSIPTTVTVRTGARIVGRLTGEPFLRRHGEPGPGRRYPVRRLDRPDQWVTSAIIIWTPAEVATFDEGGGFPEAIVRDDGGFELEPPEGRSGRLWLRRSYWSGRLGTSLPVCVLGSVEAIRSGQSAAVEFDATPFALAAIDATVVAPALDLSSDAFTLSIAGSSGGDPALHGGRTLLVVEPGRVVDRFVLARWATESYRDGSSSSWQTGTVEVRAPAALALEPGTLHEVELTVEIASLRVQLEDAGGEPVAGRTVWLFTSSDRPQLSIRTDERGVASADLFTPGSTRLELETAFGEFVALGTVSLSAGHPNEFRFTIPK